LYDDPARYDVFRAKNTHQAFGSGPHHCAGTHVARRTVGAVMLEMLFERFPKMSLPDPEVVQWRGFGFRGPINLPVILN
jgi:cytochrome P450